MKVNSSHFDFQEAFNMAYQCQMHNPIHNQMPPGCTNVKYIEMVAKAMVESRDSQILPINLDYILQQQLADKPNQARPGELTISNSEDRKNDNREQSMQQQQIQQLTALFPQQFSQPLDDSKNCLFSSHKGGQWQECEMQLLKTLKDEHPAWSYDRIAELLNKEYGSNYTGRQIKHQWQKMQSITHRNGIWTEAEDERLIQLFNQQHGQIKCIAESLKMRTTAQIRQRIEELELKKIIQKQLH